MNALFYLFNSSRKIKCDTTATNTMAVLFTVNKLQITCKAYIISGFKNFISCQFLVELT